jgi:tetratricopeptide (TPR) repeat protein
VQLLPAYTEAHNNLALAYTQAGQIEAAAMELEQTLRLKPDLLEARVNLGALLIRQGNYPDALRHLRQATQFNPEFPAAQLNLGLVLARNSEWAEAAVAYQKYVTLLPAQPDGHLKLADALLHLNQPQTARDHLQIALQLAQTQNRPDLISRAEQMLRALPAPATTPDSNPQKNPVPP